MLFILTFEALRLADQLKVGALLFPDYFVVVQEGEGFVAGAVNKDAGSELQVI